VRDYIDYVGIRRANLQATWQATVPTPRQMTTNLSRCYSDVNIFNATYAIFNDTVTKTCSLIVRIRYLLIFSFFKEY